MKNRKASLIFIFITILVDVIGLGIIIPVIPGLIEKLTGEGLSEAAGYGGLLMISFAAVQFLFAPVLGELSDRFGRRPVLLMSLFGLGLDYIFHAFAPTIGWLFVGRILAGITGASHTVAAAYIADISTKENKAKNFGMIGAAFGLGFIIGPLIGGVCAQWGIQVPFFVAAGITLLNFTFGFFVVPESLAQENRRKIDIRKMIPGVSLLKIGKYSGLGGLIIAFFLIQTAGQALPAVWSYYTMFMYKWTEAGVGYSLAVVGIMVSIVQAVLIGKVVKKFGEHKTIVVGMIFSAAGMTLFSLAFVDWMIYCFLLVYVLGGVASPTLQSYLSNKVPDNEQGNLQGALTSMVSITSIIGPAIATGLFYKFSSATASFYFPGAPYAMGGIIIGTAAVVAYFALSKAKQ